MTWSKTASCPSSFREWWTGLKSARNAAAVHRKCAEDLRSVCVEIGGPSEIVVVLPCNQLEKDTLTKETNPLVAQLKRRSQGSRSVPTKVYLK